MASFVLFSSFARINTDMCVMLFVREKEQALLIQSENFT